MAIHIHAHGVSEPQLRAQAGHETTKLFREHGGAFLYRSESPKGEQTLDFTFVFVGTDPSKPHSSIAFHLMYRNLSSGRMTRAPLDETLNVMAMDLSAKSGSRKSRTLTKNNVITVSSGDTIEVGFCFEHVPTSTADRVGIVFESEDLPAPVYSEFYYIASKVSGKKPAPWSSTEETVDARIKKQKLKHLRALIKTKTQLDATIASLQAQVGLVVAETSSASTSSTSGDDSTIDSDVLYEETLAALGELAGLGEFAECETTFEDETIATAAANAAAEAVAGFGELTLSV